MKHHNGEPNMKTSNVLMLSALSLALEVCAASLGPAVLPAGAARLDNGSLITLGQPLAGAFGTAGAGIFGHAGFLPVVQVLPVPPVPPAPQIASDFALVGGDLRLSFETAQGYRYEVQASTNLEEWTTLWSAVGTGGPVEFSDPDALSFEHRFYRVIVQ
jgi:hypothetical protein